MRPMVSWGLRQVDGDEVGLGDRAGRGPAARRPSGGHGRRTRTGRRRRAACRRPCARSATSLPMRPRPTMPSVLSASSTPSHLLRSQRPCGERGVGLRHVAGLREQQRHGVLGGGDDVALRRVDDHHAAAGGGVDVDVVEADAGPADDHQVAAGLEHLGGDLRGGADDQRVGAHDVGEQLRQVELDVDLVACGAESVEAALGDLFGDEDACHRVHRYPLDPGIGTAMNISFTTEDSGRTAAGRRPDGTRMWLTVRHGSPHLGSSAVGARNTEIERWFIRRGVPHFIDDYAPTTDIWNRSLPMLGIAYVAGGLNALKLREWSWQRNVATAVVIVAVLVAGWALINLARHRRPFVVPDVVGTPELALFLIGPTIPSLLFGQGGDAFQTLVEGAGDPRRHLPRHQLCGARTARLGGSAERSPALDAREPGRPRPAVAAAVHHVPVHQRRGVAGGRHPHRAAVRRHAGDLLRARCRVRAVAGARHHARPRHLRQLGRGPRRGRRYAGGDRGAPRVRCTPGIRPLAAAEGERRPGHRVQPVVADHLRRAPAHAVLRPVRVPRHPRGDGTGVDRGSTRCTCSSASAAAAAPW